MADNLFAPPRSPVDDIAAPIDVPAKTLKMIRNAWIAGTISTVFTLGMTLLAVSGTSVLGFSAWEFFDVALLAGLTFGIYKRSRACAVILFLYFIVSKAILVFETGQASGLVLGVVFLLFYGQGVVGTFAYHKALKRMRNPPSAVT